ncbi:MAG TPA: hypothetical protein VMU87_16660 [Stellaceae bacterium]|nr:hypothetical protein [Stellaceae bacterium]
MRTHPAAAEEPPAPLAHEEDRHTPFLMYRRFFYLKIAAAAVLVSLVLYYGYRPINGRYGGTWVGYVLGTAGALLILWLMWFGYRKRSYQSNQGKLEAWLSAHVYFGIALLVIATLHTGFHFGWNIHTLAYALMCIVIASGAFGIYCYVHYPRLMTRNRANTTMPQMLGRMAALNDELRAGAMALDDAAARLVTRAIEHTEIGGSMVQQLRARYPNCTTAAALAGVDAIAARSPPETQTAYRQVRMLLDEKAQLLTRARRDVSYKAMMDLWLYIHVPLSFALLAALLAHVLSVFFYW